MTLVLTEISQYGMVMGADSAATCKTLLPNEQTGYRVLTGVHKLFPIPYLRAGISCWGYGQVGNFETDIWLGDFIRRQQRQSQNLQEFAIQLQDELNRIIPSTQSGEAEAGFHLGGFVDTDGGQTPDFWHIHNGPSQFFANIDPHVFNANHDLAAAIEQGIYDPNDRDKIYITRNGDYQFYAKWWENFEEVITKFLRSQGIHVPKQSLQGRVEYVRFPIRSISEIYAMSTRLPSIGGQIITLAIDLNGIWSYEEKV